MYYVQTFFTSSFYDDNISQYKFTGKFHEERSIPLADQMKFRRREVKFMISTKAYELILQEFQKHMIADKHGRSTICSLYYDTPDYLLIRRSIEKPVYKEKLRIRSYGVATSDSSVFVELKKKYKKVVYKRRISLPESDAMKYLKTGEIENHTQITNEIDYFKTCYPGLAPAMLLSYEREAYYGKDDPDFRITFDTNVLWRDYDLTLTKGIYGRPLLTSDQILMEVKAAEAIPLWLVKLLSDNQIYKTSFSKYGTAYRTLFEEKGGFEMLIKALQINDENDTWDDTFDELE